MSQVLPFDTNCQACPRLSRHLCAVRASHPDYFARPVPPYGDADARLLIVGLAPGMHGANRTGRPFTGDHAGILLYQTLFDFGFANRPNSIALEDGFKLIDCRITNAVKCLPPANKPTTDEVKTCNHFLRSEIDLLPAHGMLLTLGGVAHQAVLRALDLKPGAHKFAHAAQHELPQNRILMDSYHCSRYNTQTKRLTTEMFRSVFADIRRILDGSHG